MATRQSRGDLLAYLAEQRAFLQSSAAQYDQGFVAEAKRLAVTIRVLVHDNPGSGSVSLLEQLGLKGRLNYRDTRPPGAGAGWHVARAVGSDLWA